VAHPIENSKEYIPLPGPYHPPPRGGGLMVKQGEGGAGGCTQSHHGPQYPVNWLLTGG